VLHSVTIVSLPVLGLVFADGWRRLPPGHDEPRRGPVGHDGVGS
jgi:hypothetical protein